MVNISSCLCNWRLQLVISTSCSTKMLLTGAPRFVSEIIDYSDRVFCMESANSFQPTWSPRRYWAVFQYDTYQSCHSRISVFTRSHRRRVFQFNDRNFYLGKNESYVIVGRLFPSWIPAIDSLFQSLTMQNKDGRAFLINSRTNSSSMHLTNPPPKLIRGISLNRQKRGFNFFPAHFIKQ